MNSNGQNMWGTDVATCLPQHASSKFPLESAETTTLTTEVTSTCTDLVLLNSLLIQMVSIFCDKAHPAYMSASMPHIFQQLVTLKTVGPFPSMTFIPL